jgi:hypothetical protein
MIKNKDFIDALIKNKVDFQFAVRTIASEEKEYSKFKPYTKESEKLIYNSKLIDGVKLKFRHTTVTVNARHKFY